MNLSRHIKVTQKELDSWIQYLLDSGYVMRADVYDTGVTHVTLNADGSLNSDYGAVEILNKGTGRWNRWIMVRIPKSN